jgi:CRP-like cAMP-binding protein
MENQLLAALPLRDYARVVRVLTVIPLTLNDVIQRPGERVRDVLFPGGGFYSLLSVLADGSMVEVATVGREGMVGMPAILDRRDGVASLTMVQGASEIGYRMAIADFRREMARHGPFYALLMRYAYAHSGFVMQSTACNAKHTVEQRLARWLLLAHDRVGHDEFPLTQAFAAMMLGASRPTVTTVAHALQRAGLIAYRRGVLRILDRSQLEVVSCECYRVTATLLHEVTAR